MNFMSRTWLYIIRKRGKSILLLVVLMVISTFVLTALALGNASNSAQQNLRKNLGGNILIGFDYSQVTVQFREMGLLFLIGMGIVTMSAGISSITVMRLKPREILSKMS